MLGAGAAGLACARRIAEQGGSVAVIEARDRIGGRVFTKRPGGWPVPVELGAEFVHGEAPALFSVLHAAGLSVLELSDAHFTPRDGRLAPLEQAMIGGMEILSDHDGEDEPLDDKLARLRADGTISEDEARIARGYVEGFYAAPAARVSSKSIARQETAGDEIHLERAFRVLEGLDRAMQWLLHGLRPNRDALLLDHVVKRVAWRPGRVEVRCTSKAGIVRAPVVGRRCVVALPIGVLRAGEGERGGLAFDPPLPEEKRRAVEGMDMGTAHKPVLLMEETFWTDEGLLPEGESPRALGYVHAWDAAFPTWWTASPLRVPVVTGWAGGEKARALSGMDEDERAARALDALAAAFPVERSRLDRLFRGIRDHDWRADPFARGAYAYALAGHADAPDALALPVDDALFFAGEATHAEHMGTVHGAIETGLRAADEVLLSLQRG